MTYFMRTLLAMTLGAILICSASEVAALPQPPATLPSCPASGVEAISPFFHQDQTLYARSGDDLWRSTDGDATWQLVYQAPTEDHFVSSLLIAPIAREEGLHLYLTVGERGGMTASYSRTHSPDGGATWEERWTDSRVACWEAATNQEGTIFASCATLTPSDPAHDGIHRSIDHGHTWQQVWSAGSGWEPAVPSPDFANDQTIYAVRIGIFADNKPYPMLSTDGGLTWEDISPGLCPEHSETNVRKIIVSPDFTVDHTLFGVAYSHLLKSEDGGTSWQHLYPEDDDPCQVSSDSVLEVALSPDYAADRMVFIRTVGGLYVSYDGGRHWRQLIEGNHTRDLYVRRHPETSYRSVYLPLILQGNGSDNIVFYRLFLPLLVGSGILPRSTPITLFVKRFSESAYIRSDDGGVTWRCLNLPSPSSGGSSP